MAKLKVFHLITGLSTGGAERALFNVLEGGLSESFESTVVSLGHGGVYVSRLRDLGISVHCLGFRRGSPSLNGIGILRILLRELKPNVIQGWMYHGNITASVVRRFASNNPILAWNIRHSLYNLASEKRLTRQVIRANRFLSSRVDALLYNSELSRRQHEKFGFHGAQGKVIPNGFDLEVWRPDRGNKAALRIREDIPPAVKVIGHVARFHPMKDHARFVRTAVRVVKSCDDVHVVMAGHGVNENNDTLSSLVPFGLKSRFHWLGERHDLTALMRTLDVLCLSSAWGEAFPNVLGEAMASGVPCVATDVGDSARIVGETGEVVAPEDDDALFSGLMMMLKKSPVEREALGQAARRRIKANFSIDSIVDQYTDLYQRLVRQKGKQ